MTLAVIGQNPGMVASRWLAGSIWCHSRMADEAQTLQFRLTIDAPVGCRELRAWQQTATAVLNTFPVSNGDAKMMYALKLGLDKEWS